MWKIQYKTQTIPLDHATEIDLSLDKKLRPTCSTTETLNFFDKRNGFYYDSSVGCALLPWCCRYYCLNFAAIVLTSQPLFVLDWVIVCEWKPSAWNTAWPSMWSSLCTKTMIQNARLVLSYYKKYVCESWNKRVLFPSLLMSCSWRFWNTKIIYYIILFKRRTICYV